MFEYTPHYFTYIDSNQIYFANMHQLIPIYNTTLTFYFYYTIQKLYNTNLLLLICVSYTPTTTQKLFTTTSCGLFKFFGSLCVLITCVGLGIASVRWRWVWEGGARVFKFVCKLVLSRLSALSGRFSSRGVLYGAGGLVCWRLSGFLVGWDVFGFCKLYWILLKYVVSSSDLRL